MRFIDSTYDMFCKENENKKIICIGAGKLLDAMFMLWDKSITSKVEIILDNYKVGDYHISNFKTIRINKVSVISQLNLEKYVILITSMYCRSIYEQLKELLNDKDVDCYIYTVMSLKTESFKLIKKNKEQVIPKVIHFFWFGKGSIPEENLRCIESWKKYCPDYEIVKWTEDNYDVTKCLYMKQAYENKKWGFVPDYARLDIIYKYGGIYLDTDVELVRNLDELLYEDAFVGFQRNYWIALGLGFGGKKGNLIFKELMKDYEKETFIKNSKLNLIASPYYQTKGLMKHGLKCNNKLQYVADITVLPTEALDPQGFSFGKIELTKNSFSIHHYSESWVDERQRKENLDKYQQINYFR